ERERCKGGDGKDELTHGAGSLGCRLQASSDDVAEFASILLPRTCGGGRVGRHHRRSDRSFDPPHRRLRRHLPRKRGGKSAQITFESFIATPMLPATLSLPNM